MTDTSPRDPAYVPLVAPGGRCFHCGATQPGGAACGTCGEPAALTRQQEAGRIAYLLRALGQAVAEGRLPRETEQRLSAPFRERLAPGSVVTAPAPRPRPAPAPRKPVNFMVVWANALLYLGAFFIVMTALIFLLAMGGLGRTVIAALLAMVFLGTGLICRRIEIVRSAGTIFTATGALILPLVFVALANYLSDNSPLTPTQIWFSASLACGILYAAFAGFGLGRFYAVLALLAASNGWLALAAILDLPAHWMPAWVAAHVLMLCGGHHALRGLIERPFGPLVLVWGLLWALPALVMVAIVTAEDAHPAASVAGLVLLIAASALNAWRLQDAVSPLVLGVLGLALAHDATRLLAAPGWASGLALTAVSAVYVGYWQWQRGTTAGRELLALGFATALLTPFLPLYDQAHGVGLVVGLGGTAVLAVSTILLRQALLLLAPGATLGILWWYLLQLLPFKGTTAVDLGRGYLPVVVVLALLALVLPVSLPAAWRSCLGLLAGFYAVGVSLLVSDSSGALAVTLGLYTLLGALMVGRWQNPWLLALPGATGFGLVLTSLRYLDVRSEASGPAVLLVGIACSAAGLALRSFSTRFSLAFRVLGIALSAGAFGVACLVQLGPAAEWTSHLTAACLLTIAGLIAVEGIWQRNLLYPASAVLMSAVLWEIAALHFEDLQCYAVPLGFYLMAVAIVSARDSGLGKASGPASSIAWLASPLVFGLATFIQSFGNHAVRYAIIMLAECLVLLALGLLVRRRTLLGAATTLLVLGGVRLLFETPELILPALALAGILLLAGGFIVLILVGLKQRAKGAEPPQ